MRKKRQNIVKRLVTTLVVVMVAFSSHSTLWGSQEEPLKQTLKLIKKSAEISGKVVKEELKTAEKLVKDSLKYLKKGEKESAVGQMKIAVITLRKALDHPESQEERFKNSINGALKNLYAAIQQVKGFIVTTETSHGIYTATLSTVKGKINVNFPMDMAAGERISGTVYVMPEGKTEAEIEKNMVELNKYVVEIEELKIIKIPVTQKRNSWKLSKAINSLHLGFKDEDDIELGTTEVPVHLTPPVSPPTEFQLPTIGQAENFLKIEGPFNGEFDNTSVFIGDYGVELIAESKQSLIFLTPAHVIGQTKITLKEEDYKIEGEYHNINVELSAEKTRLIKGEITPLTVTLSGLDGFNEPILLNIENKTPGVVNLEGGGIIDIHPGKVDKEGICTYTCSVHAIQTGEFKITAEIIYEFYEAMIAHILNETGQEVGKAEDAAADAEQAEDVVRKIIKDKIGTYHTDLNDECNNALDSLEKAIRKAIEAARKAKNKVKGAATAKGKLGKVWEDLKKAGDDLKEANKKLNEYKSKRNKNKEDESKLEPDYVEELTNQLKSIRESVNNILDNLNKILIKMEGEQKVKK